VSERRAADARAWVVLAYPVAMLGVFFLGPFLIMLAASFYRRIPGGFYEPAFVLDNWKQLLSELFVDRALFSLRVSLLAGWLAVLVAFPFTYALTTMPRRRQVALLVLVLSSLSLSEVIVGFSWSVLLGRAAGISNILVWLGLMDEAEAYAPGFWAVMLGLLSIAFPYCVLTMYPPLSRLDREVTEAAQMLGASPWRTFWTVVVPIARPTIVAGFLLVFVFTLGSYLISAILGRPEHWTVSVFISDQASFNANVPFAAAMALFLTIVSLAIVGAVLWFERRAAAREG
jgi:putative spermidine/putrescine transport system permease protein